jgi:hypothetical protein
MLGLGIGPRAVVQPVSLGLIAPNDITDPAWTVANATPTANVSVAPDGTTTMDRLTATGAFGTARQDVAAGGTTRVRTTLIIRPGTCVDFYLQHAWLTGGATQVVQLRLNPQTGAVLGIATSGGATALDHGVQPLAGGFLFLWVDGVGSDALNTAVRFQSYVAVSGEYADLWGASASLMA